MKTQFTPGPWHIAHNSIVSCAFVATASGNILAEVPLDRNYQKAARNNAALIAAAPDLYAALLGLKMSQTSEAWTLADSALRKARGEK